LGGFAGACSVFYWAPVFVKVFLRPRESGPGGGGKPDWIFPGAGKGGWGGGGGGGGRLFFVTGGDAGGLGKTGFLGWKPPGNFGGLGKWGGGILRKKWGAGEVFGKLGTRPRQGHFDGDTKNGGPAPFRGGREKDRGGKWGGRGGGGTPGPLFPGDFFFSCGFCIKPGGAPGAWGQTTKKTKKKMIGEWGPKTNRGGRRLILRNGEKTKTGFVGGFFPGGPVWGKFLGKTERFWVTSGFPKLFKKGVVFFPATKIFFFCGGASHINSGGRANKEQKKKKTPNKLLAELFFLVFCGGGPPGAGRGRNRGQFIGLCGPKGENYGQGKKNGFAKNNEAVSPFLEKKTWSRGGPSPKSGGSVSGGGGGGKTRFSFFFFRD